MKWTQEGWEEFKAQYREATKGPLVTGEGFDWQGRFWTYRQAEVLINGVEATGKCPFCNESVPSD